MYIAHSMAELIDIVSSKRKAEILRLFFGVSPTEIHLREVARRSGLAVRTVQQELTRMVRAGLIQSRRDGNRMYYCANRGNPVYGDLRNIVLKTADFASAFREALRDPDIRVAFIFGSIASGAARPDSDIDLLVIGKIGLRRVSHLLAGLSTNLGREINPHTLTVPEFVRRRRTGDHFISSVLASPRLFVLGSEHELGELGQ